jgi:DinB superfamily
MNYQTISEIYEANDQIREQLKSIAANLTDAQINTLPDGEKWTVGKLIEHISIVDEGIVKISAKLLNEAKESGETSEGAAKISDDFAEKVVAGRNAKFEAPERVHPTGAKTVAESLVKLDETREKLEDLRPLFESVECSNVKFPHPAFGDMSAHEWLALLGGHELRHIRQINNLLDKIQ